MKLLIFLIGMIASDSVTESPKRIDPIVFSENIDLKRYLERKTIRLNENELIVIAQPEEHDVNDEGLRLIYLRRNDQKLES